MCKSQFAALISAQANQCSSINRLHNTDNYCQLQPNWRRKYVIAALVASTTLKQIKHPELKPMSVTTYAQVSAYKFSFGIETEKLQ